MAVLGHTTQYSYLAYCTLHNVSFEITRISLKGFLGLINERENRSKTSVSILFFLFPSPASSEMFWQNNESLLKENQQNL